MNRLAARLLKVTAVGHALIGLVLFRVPLAAIVGDGVLNSVTGQLDREAAFWFLLFSPICFALGQIVERAVHQGDARLLAIVGWHLLGIGVVGAIIMPVSGFWIVIAIAPLVLTAARHTGPATASA